MYKYSVGDYYRQAVGDYYSGDPFLGKLFGAGAKLIGKLIKPAAKTALALTPVGTAVTLGGAALDVAKRIGPTAAGAGGTALALRSAMQVAPPGQVPVPGIKGKIQRFLPGGKTGFVKRRTMNHLNQKALTRATRRLEGFRTKATKALRELGYVVARSGSKRASSARSCACPRGKCTCQ